MLNSLSAIWGRLARNETNNQGEHSNFRQTVDARPSPESGEVAGCEAAASAIRLAMGFGCEAPTPKPGVSPAIEVLGDFYTEGLRSPWATVTSAGFELREVCLGAVGHSASLARRVAHRPWGMTALDPSVKPPTPSLHTTCKPTPALVGGEPIRPSRSQLAGSD